MLEEWAYATAYTSEAARVAAFPDWLHHYNHWGHTSLIGEIQSDGLLVLVDTLEVGGSCF